MLKIDKPLHSFESSITECIKGITGNSLLAENILLHMEGLVEASNFYVNASSDGTLYLVPPLDQAAADPTVVGAVKKTDLVKLYDQYFAKQGKPARKIYTDILVGAKEKCPYCGGLGRPKNLDHYLPKSHFPQFSVLPINLIPACRDCNMDGKASNFATIAEKQIIQPYCDRENFFKDQWIFSELNGSIDDPTIEISFFARPPDTWNNSDKERARNHFISFDLASRYSIKAAAHRSTIVDQIRTMEAEGISASLINKILLEPGIRQAPFINHWQRGFYQALSHTLIK